VKNEERAGWGSHGRAKSGNLSAIVETGGNSLAKPILKGFLERRGKGNKE